MARKQKKPLTLERLDQRIDNARRLTRSESKSLNEQHENLSRRHYELAERVGSLEKWKDRFFQLESQLESKFRKEETARILAAVRKQVGIPEGKLNIRVKIDKLKVDLSEEELFTSSTITVRLCGINGYNKGLEFEGYSLTTILQEVSKYSRTSIYRLVVGRCPTLGESLFGW